MERIGALGVTASDPDAVRASAAEFILEGLYAHRRIDRSEERGFTGDERHREIPQSGEARRAKRQFN
jgi:magnesium chelatase subunit I